MGQYSTLGAVRLCSTTAVQQYSSSTAATQQQHSSRSGDSEEGRVSSANPTPTAQLGVHLLQKNGCRA
jgi:hypothetical protein